MKIGNRNYTRSEVSRRIGNIAQLGGTRHYTLDDGRSRGVRAVDFDTGSGFRFTVLPDRGMDISLCSFRGTKLVYLTPGGEVHPAYYDLYGPGWLRSFFGGLLTTCGLTYLGPPGPDGDEELGLHGRHSSSPACRVCDTSRWEDDEYVLELTGIVEDAVLFGDKIRLTRTISTRIGSKSLSISDTAENFGYKTSPFTILYHINSGFPLLDDWSELIVSSESTEAYEAWVDRESMLRFSAPVKDCREQNFHHVMRADLDGTAYAAMINPALMGGLGLCVAFKASSLPYLNEWKMMGEGDYVVGIEPCNVPCENRAVLRERGMLPVLEPGDAREMRLEIGILDGADEIAEFRERISPG